MKQSQRAQYQPRFFNFHYIDIVEKSCGKKPSQCACDKNATNTRQAIHLVVQLYLDHPSINRIRTISKNQTSLITSSSNACGINPVGTFALLSAFDIKKAVRFDMIPPQLVKTAASVLYQHFSMQ